MVDPLTIIATKTSYLVSYIMIVTHRAIISGKIHVIS